MEEINLVLWLEEEQEMLLHCCASKAIDHCKDVFVAFVDYEKAFDRVHWPKLMEVLAKIGVDYRDRKMIWNLYMNQTASVMIDGEISDPAVIGRGVRQGGPLSTILYNIYAEFMITERGIGKQQRWNQNWWRIGSCS